MPQPSDMQRTHFDYWFVVVAILLVIIGVVMVYTSSAVLAAERFGDTYYFLKKEIVFVFIGGSLAYCAARIPYHLWKKLVYPLMFISALLILLTYIPGLRNVASGAARWVQIGPFTFQPSELAKISFVMFLAYSMEKKFGKMERFGVGVLPHIFVGGCLMLIILGQKDFGTAFTIGSIMMLLLYVGGVRPMYLVSLALSAAPFVYFAVAQVPYRRRRVLAFLDPWSDRYGSGFQIIQSLISFQQGGIVGRGLGEGQQKLFYLPEAHTDFIAAVLGEELGLLGILTVIILFGMLALRGFSIASRAPDLFGRYLALGLTLLITWQALANLGVVMGLLPTKGLVLPFISYGGSSLIVTLLCVGMLANISTYRADSRNKVLTSHA